LEKETSPKRFAELLQAIYEALALFFGTPKNYGDSMWLTYVHRLQAERDVTGLTELQINWAKEPEVAYTDDKSVERYYVPGNLKISYTGQDWGADESQKILQQGFDSVIIHDLLQKRKSGEKVVTRSPAKQWYERPIGIIAIGVTVAVISAGIIYFLRWN